MHLISLTEAEMLIMHLISLTKEEVRNISVVQV